MKPQLLVSSATAGSGKTLFAMGMARVLKRRGQNVQPFKCGPDFCDSQLLSIVSDADTVNLDAWLSSNTHVQYLYNKYGEQVDVCITEGAGGLFDGYRRMQGSTAETAGLLGLPVILLVNARLAGYSVAPLIYGFKNYFSGVRLAGVVFTQVASSAHYHCLREACADASVDCLGYMPFVEGFKLPPKRTAVSLANRRMLNELAEQIADQLEKTVDINRLLNRCNRNFPCQYTLPYCSDVEPELDMFPKPIMKIAVARDPAFSFIYRENISRLELLGKVSFFSPLYGYELPEADLIYFPGGYPELFARQLHRRYKMMESIAEFAESGGKVLAEGGGMVFLGRTLKSRENGTAYPMSNIFPVDFVTPSVPKIYSGYRKMTSGNLNLKGYEFRYTSVFQDKMLAGYKSVPVTNLKGVEEVSSLFRYKNVIGSYAHWYWGDKDILQLWQDNGK